MKSSNQISKFLDQKTFGNQSENAKPDMILITQHSGTADHLKTLYPDIYDKFLRASALPEELLIKYLDLEADRGAIEFALELSEIMSSVRSDLKIVLMQLNLPRGICDLNRNLQTAHRDIIDWQANQNNDLYSFFTDQFLRLNEYSTVFLDQAYSLSNGNKFEQRPNAFLDVHTMAPHDRVNPIKEQPGEENIMKYNASFMAAPHGDERKINFFTIFDGFNLSISELLDPLRAQLEKDGHAVATDEAYRLGSIHSSTRYLLATNGSGLCFDLTKHALSSTPDNPDLVASKLDKFEINPQNTTKLAESFAKNLLQRYK